MSKYKKVVYLILLVSFSFFSVFWMLSVDNSFSYDDVNWMFKVSTTSYEDWFRFFPASVYLDRPVGAIFLKFLYSVFGLDYCRHHVVLVMIHLLNVVLTFVVSTDIFERKYKDNDKSFWGGGVITAGFFGIWSRTHMAVQWDAAIFDLLGTFWCLLSILFYLRYQKNDKYKGQNMLFSLFFFYLAIRTKEMFLILPILFVLYEVWDMILDGKAKRLSRVSQYGLLVFVVFLSLLLYLKSFGEIGITNDINNPYYQSFNPISMIHTLLKYATLCFDLQNGGWAYSPSFSGLLGAIVLLIGLIIGIVKAVVHKKFELLFCYLSIGISIVIVLPMVNQVHVLYLYFPSIFVGLLIACMVGGVKRADSVVMVLLYIFLAATGAGGNIKTQRFWIENAKIEAKAWRDIENIQEPPLGSTIYIKNSDQKDYTPFFYGEGAVCKLLYNDETLSVKLLTEDEWDEIEFVKPYVLWEYREERINEMGRNEEREIYINAVYQYPQEDGSLVLGIVPDTISNPMKIYVDGREIQLEIGETFTSVCIPAELIKDRQLVTLKIEDAFGTLSEEYILHINK